MGFDDFLPASPKGDPEALEQGDDLLGAEQDSSPEFEDSVRLDPNDVPDIVLSDSPEESPEEHEEDAPELAPTLRAHSDETEQAGEVEAELGDDLLPDTETTAAEQVEIAAGLASELTSELDLEEQPEIAAEAPEPALPQAEQQAAAASVDEPLPATASVGAPSEDLFNFDQPLDRVPASVVAARESEPEPDAAIESPAQAALEPQPDPTPTDALPTKVLVPVKAPLGVPPLVAGALALLLALNLLVLFTTWRSQSMAQSFVAEMGHQMLVTTEEMKAEGERRTRSLREVAQIMAEPREQGYEILDAIERDIQKGEFERARRSLHELLAIGDSLAPAVREDILARASFRIGDTLQMQALAVAAAEGHKP